MTIQYCLPSGSLTRRRALAIAGAGLATAFIRPANAQWPSLLPLSNPNVSSDPARIYLLRGLFGIFSTGMDSLSGKLSAQGYNPNLLSWTDASVVVDQITTARRGGDDKPIILIGHSLGSNAVAGIAQQLGQQNIPVDLVVTFDVTEPMRASANVRTFINFFQYNGFGRPVSAGPGFTGELQNIDLSADKNISHGNIDEAASLQQVVTERIFSITNRQMQTAATQQRNRVRR
jgi:hypothetical protein